MCVKQVIVMRSDLNMRKGKMIAQGAHASMKVLVDRGIMQYGMLSVSLTDEMAEWLLGSFTKICVKVGSEEELLQSYEFAQSAMLPCSLIKDSGLTEFGGIPTFTCCAIGPAEASEIDKITGHLTLL